MRITRHILIQSASVGAVILGLTILILSHKHDRRPCYHPKPYHDCD